MRNRKSALTIFSGNRETRLIVHVADTQEKMAKGLMFVQHLPENEGMLFVFPRETYGGFWMKNTFIPLAIAFLDSDGEILKMMDMAPCLGDNCPIYDPKISYRYALEVNLGWFDRNRIKAGDFVTFD